MSILMQILMLLSSLGTNPIVMKILTCLTNPANTTWALKLACVTSATGGVPLTPAEANTIEAIKEHIKAADKSAVAVP